MPILDVTIAPDVTLTQEQIDLLAHVISHMKPNTAGWLLIELPEPLLSSERNAFMALTQKFRLLTKKEP